MEKCEELSMAEIIDVINNSEFCWMSCIDTDNAYVIPMCFKYEQDGCCSIFTLCCKNSCQRLDSIENGSSVCLGFDVQKCCAIESVIAHGKAELIPNMCKKCNKPIPGSFSIKVCTSHLSGRRYQCA